MLQPSAALCFFMHQQPIDRHPTTHPAICRRLYAWALCIAAGVLLLGALWLARSEPWLARPAPQVTGATALPCVSYAPFRRDGHTPFDPGLRLDERQITDDLVLLSTLTRCIRLYGMSHGLDQVPAVARRLGLQVVLGAWIGVSTGVMARMGTGMSAIIFLAGAFGFMFAIEKFKNSGVGVALLLGFTFFMGLMLSRMLAAILGLSNGASLIMYAFGTTAAVFFGMASLATVIKRDLGGMGKFLFVGAILLLVAGLINLFVQSSVLMMTISVIAAGLFSAYMLYDIKQVMDGGETNYVSATLAIYLDIYNVFQSLLALFGIFGGEKE